MTPSVTLLTEREHVVRQWQQALTKHDIESKVVAPSDLADAVAGQLAVIVDVDGAQLDADELLSTIGFVRASGALPVAHVDRDRDALEGIITEMTESPELIRSTVDNFEAWARELQGVVKDN